MQSLGSLCVDIKVVMPNIQVLLYIFQNMNVMQIRWEHTKWYVDIPKIFILWCYCSLKSTKVLYIKQKHNVFVPQDWGRPGDLWNLDIRWHVPSVEETSFAFYLLDLILQPELQRLQRFAQGEQDMSRYAKLSLSVHLCLLQQYKYRSC